MSVSTRKPGLDGRAAATDALRELASRQADGISVRLYWRPRCDDVIVRVSDGKTGEEFTLEPPVQSALAAFYHPYAMKEPQWQRQPK
jgi:hypothetical protein